MAGFVSTIVWVLSTYEYIRLTISQIEYEIMINGFFDWSELFVGR